MLRNARQVKDDVSRRVNDERIDPLDIETETTAMGLLVPEWPVHWRYAGFTPSGDLADCVELTERADLGAWSVTCVEPGVTYQAYVGSEDYSVVSFSPSRALFLAAWNCYRLRNDGENE